jgi:hypothetical protein
VQAADDPGREERPEARHELVRDATGLGKGVEDAAE